MEVISGPAPNHTNRPAPAMAAGNTEWAETMRQGNLEFYHAPNEHYQPQDEHHQKQAEMYQRPEEQPLMAASGKKKVFGLGPKVALLLLLGVILIVGVVVGVAVGVTHKKHSGTDSQSSTSSPAKSGTSTATATSSAASSTPSPTTIAVLSANYGGIDVTQEARSDFLKKNTLSIDSGPFPLDDTWPDNEKCLSILHSVGSSIRTFVACENSGNYTLTTGSFKPTPNDQEITRQGPTATNFTLVSVVWGALEIRNQSVYQQLVQAKEQGTQLTFGNDLFGNDTLPNNAKSAVIWYTEDNFTTFKSVSGREDVSFSF